MVRWLSPIQPDAQGPEVAATDYLPAVVDLNVVDHPSGWAFHAWITAAACMLHLLVIKPLKVGCQSWLQHARHRHPRIRMISKPWPFDPQLCVPAGPVSCAGQAGGHKRGVVSQRLLLQTEHLNEANGPTARGRRVRGLDKQAAMRPWLGPG